MRRKCRKVVDANPLWPQRIGPRAIVPQAATRGCRRASAWWPMYCPAHRAWVILDDDTSMYVPTSMSCSTLARCFSASISSGEHL